MLSRFESRRLIVAIALLVRITFVIAGHQYRFPATADHWSFGWETGRVARSIAIGHGFASPFQPHETGPTSFLPPLYPYLVAGIFKLFGIYSTMSAVVLLLINCICGALTCWVIYAIGLYAFRRAPVAALAGWIWALFPLTIWPVRWVWETNISTLLLAVLFLRTLERRNCDSLRGWLVLGLLWGVAALFNVSCLVFMPLALLWIICKESPFDFAVWTRAAVCVGVMLLVCAPWIVRNAVTFHRFIFIRGGGAVTLRDGNGPEGNGAWIGKKDPSNNASELAEYELLGEQDYTKLMKAEAMQFIREYPLKYAANCLRRVYYFWGGPPDEVPSIATTARNWLGLAFSATAWIGLFLALKRGQCGSLLFAALLLSYPLTFYLVLVFFRYRHPIEPEMTLLCAYFAFNLSGFEVRELGATNE